MFKPNYKLTNKILNDIASISEGRETILLSPILPLVEDKLRKEAIITRTHHSTSIEGNPLNIREVKIIAEKGEIKAKPKDKREIENYLNVLKYLESSAKKTKINTSMICKIQALVTKNILPSKQCGKYRDRMVYVVNKLGQTVFTPPQAKVVPTLIKDLTNWLNNKETLRIHPIIVAGIAHYEFVRIHPFTDGNGRAGRSLATFILYQRDFDIKHFFSLDDYYNENREAYYTALQYVDTRSRDLTQWLEYFVRGVALQIEKLKTRVESLSHEPVLKKLKKRIILKERQWKLLEYIKETGKITNSEYQKIAGVSREMAKRDLTLLDKEDILTKKGKGRNIYYVFSF